MEWACEMALRMKRKTSSRLREPTWVKTFWAAWAIWFVVGVSISFCSNTAYSQSYDYKVSTQLSLTASVVVIKATKGPLLWYQCINTGVADAWVQLFDTAAAITLGTTAPARSIPVAAGSSTGVVPPQPPWSANTSIQAAATTTQTGAAAPATALQCEFAYR
jgi:hypothetical protein